MSTLKHKSHVMKIKIIITLCLFTFLSCTNLSTRKNYKEHNKLLHDEYYLGQRAFLKAHLSNGDIVVYDNKWNIDTIKKTLTGNGKLYDFNRNVLSTGEFTIYYKDVAIFETNTKLNRYAYREIIPLTILTTANLALSSLCLTNPKACFGSCPTFYINENDNFHFSNAEGFSNAIAPSLEYADVDALNNDFKPIKSFSIVMKNEALETHCLNEIKLLAYPRKVNQRVYHTRYNEYYLCGNTYLLNRAINKNLDETKFLKYQDKQERYSYADTKKLNAKEEIILEFEGVAKESELGLIMNFRQTLMTTYFIYSAMGYMGNQVSDVFTKIEEEKNLRNKIDVGIKKELGEIDVYIWNDTKSKWQFTSSLYETGPIAINQQLIPLKSTSNNGKVIVKIVVNKGLWRIDYAALTNIISKVEPIEVHPNKIYNKNQIDQNALSNLRNDKSYMISLPGDEYKINFELPAEDDYELFLFTKGYYLEWMRENWLKDKNLWKLRTMFENPKKYLRSELKNYKEYEKTMETEFWNSKIDTKNDSYYEN